LTNVNDTIIIIMGHMLVLTTFLHIYFLVGNDCARSQWFEAGGYRYKKSREYT